MRSEPWFRRNPTCRLLGSGGTYVGFVPASRASSRHFQTQSTSANPLIHEMTDGEARHDDIEAAQVRERFDGSPARAMARRVEVAGE